MITEFGSVGGQSIAGASFITTFGVKKSFTVLPNALPDFITEYCEAVFEEQDSDKTDDLKGLSIAEMRTTDRLPVMITLKLAFSLERQESKSADFYSDDFVQVFVKTTQDVLRSMIEVQPTFQEIITCVLESDYYTEDGLTVVKIKLHFPYTQLDVDWQKSHLIPELCKAYSRSRLLSYADIQPIKSIEEMISVGGDSNPMYYSKASVNESVLTLKSIYGAIDDGYLEDGAGPVMLKDVFMPSSHSYFIRGMISDCIFKDNTDINTWVPLFLSINYWAGSTIVKESSECGSVSGFEFCNIGSKDPTDIASQMLPLISVRRFDDEPSWLDIGQALWNVTNQSDFGMKMWIQYSSQSIVDGRESDDCAIKWSCFQNNSLTEKNTCMVR